MAIFRMLHFETSIDGLESENVPEKYAVRFGVFAVEDYVST